MRFRAQTDHAVDLWRRAVGVFAVFAVLLCVPDPSARAEPDAPPPKTWLRFWPDTDFTKRGVDLSEIINGGVPKDGIPAIDAPSFMPAAEETGLDPKEPVIAVEIGGEARAYPIRYLLWHEIVNDRIGARPFTVTYCPLCNSAIVFDGRLGGEELTFGVSGKLRLSDMIMYDRQSESWWQQFTGEAIVGDRLGAKLTVLPSAMISWRLYRQDHPDGQVMREPEGEERPYGANPYVGYDESHWPFLYTGDAPPHDIPALTRVVRVNNRAWPLERLSEVGELVEEGVRLTWVSGQASALETREIAAGRDIGDVRVFDAATDEPLAFEVTFAFVFHAFEPEGQWMLGDP